MTANIAFFILRGLNTRLARHCFLLAAFSIFCAGAARAQTYPASWPSDSAWTAYTYFGSSIQDLSTSGGDPSDGGTGVNPDSSDVYNGTSGTLPSVYFTYNSTSQVLFFRMRLRGNPLQGGGSELQNGTWNAVLDTDGDGFKEFFVEANGNNTDTLNIYYGNTDRQSIVSADCGDGEGRVFTVNILKDSHYRVITNTATGGGYFLDFQAPLSGFDNCAGAQSLTATTPFSITFTTSATTQNPSQKDLVGAGDYTMGETVPLPAGDLATLTSGLIQAPKITGASFVCGTGTNSSPITLTATTLDTLMVSGTGSTATIVDSIASVTFEYQMANTPFTLIAQLTSPKVNTVNTWETSWNTSALSPGFYYIRITVVDNEGNTTFDNRLAIDVGSCSTVLSPSAVDLISFSASNAADGRVVVSWETGLEVDNLGFNLYREQDGKQMRISPQIIAGSALLAGPGVMLTAGKSYQWVDQLPKNSGDIRYWLEDLDLKGTSTWHGPVTVDYMAAASELSYEQQAPALSDLNTHADQATAGEPLERKARSVKATAATTAMQLSVASGPAIKIEVKNEGWYRVSQPDLVRAGLNPKANPRLLQLYADGQELSVTVSGDRDGRFDPEDSLEFYGLGADTPFTATRVYWLAVGSAPGKRIGRAESRGTPAGPGSFPFTIERRERSIYYAALVNGEAENFFGALVSNTPVDQSLKVKNLAETGAHQSILEVALQGVTGGTHQVNLRLNNVEVGSLRFTGKERGVVKINVPQSILREGDNSLKLMAELGAGDISLVDYIRLTYSRSRVAEGNGLKLTAQAGEQIAISSFTGMSVRVLDVTDPASPLEVSAVVKPEGEGYSATFTAPGAGRRTLLAVGGDQFKQPAAIRSNLPSSWRSPATAADLVIIARREYFAGLEPLRAAREGQGLRVAVIDVEDAYDEFSFGQKTPQAIKDLLFFARNNWKTAPSFVLLAGDATFDPKDYLGRGDKDLVPTKLVASTHLETASDDWFVDFDNDSIAEMAVGRLPFTTPEEVAGIVSKIVAYDRSENADMAIFVADQNDSYDFETANHEARALLPSSFKAEELRRSSGDNQAIKATLIEAINRGPKLVTYLGHGSQSTWRGNIFTNADVQSLSNTDRPAIFVIMACLNGMFHDIGRESFAEALLKSRTGGAVAVWASSGLSDSPGQSSMNHAFYRELFGTKGIRLGEAARRAKAGTQNKDVRRTWVFFGDPSMRLR